MNVTAKSTTGPRWAGDRRGDLPFSRGVLITEDDPADPVGDGVADPCGPDRVERVHGRDQPEPRSRPHRAQPGHRDLALGEHGDQDVEGFLRDPTSLAATSSGHPQLSERNSPVSVPR